MPLGDFFNPDDPMAWLQQPAQAPQAAPAKMPLLPPQEEDSLLSNVTGTVMGGLQLAGNVLGTLGRPVRTALAGNWGDVLPSIFQPSRATSGEDLLKQYGLLEGEGEKGSFEWRDLAGPA